MFSHCHRLSVVARSNLCIISISWKETCLLGFFFLFFNILSLVSWILQTYVHLWIVLIFPENILIFLNMPESEY